MQAIQSHRETLGLETNQKKLSKYNLQARDDEEHFKIMAIRNLNDLNSSFDLDAALRFLAKKIGFDSRQERIIVSHLDQNKKVVFEQDYPRNNSVPRIIGNIRKHNSKELIFSIYKIAY